MFKMLDTLKPTAAGVDGLIISFVSPDWSPSVLQANSLSPQPVCTL